MEVVTKIAPIALALIMLALGLGLTGQDFLRVAKQPKDFLVGLICQLILLPIIAFLLLKIFNLPLEIVIEDNGKSVYTDTKKVWNIKKLKFPSDHVF